MNIEMSTRHEFLVNEVPGTGDVRGLQGETTAVGEPETFIESLEPFTIVHGQGTRVDIVTDAFEVAESVNAE